MRVIRAILLIGFILSGPSLAAAYQPGSLPDERGRAVPVVRRDDAHDASPALHTVRPNPPRAGQLRDLPRKWLPNRRDPQGPFDSDPVVQTEPGTAASPGALVSFEGLGNRNGFLPSDANGDIGPNHYVQTVNMSFAVYNRAGALLYGPANLNTLWGGFGGPCETENDGDPIVLYDHLADRWLISQFALPNYPYGPFYQCIAISQTPDPTGAWHRYQFTISQNKMNDYPKFGVWPDGYYMTINQFNQGSLGWAGAGAVVFERDQMLHGQTARMVYFDLHSIDPNLGGMLPSDLDGPAPPAGAPNPFVAADDDAWDYPQDQIEVWDFHVDWVTPNQSTFSRAATLATAPFDSNLCSASRNCIPQPGTTIKLDPISDRMMFRLQYRNFGTHETLVTNHTVDVNNTDRAGVRWYELRKSSNTWSIHQQGTYSPDGNHRWTASIAMNSRGDIGLGYSVSSGTTYPSVRYTGRLAGDPTGQMSLVELTLVDGTGSQTHSMNRWGDYSMMAVDPADDCTFWYTQQYYQITSTSSWRTRIGAFQLASCPPLPTPSRTPTATSTFTPGPTWTSTTTFTATSTGTATSSATVTGTATPTSTMTSTPTPTETPTSTPTATVTPTHTTTATSTPTSTSTPYFRWRQHLPMLLRAS
jgi:hypothetical protein